MFKKFLKKYAKAILVKLDEFSFLTWYQKFIVPMGHGLKNIFRGIGGAALSLSASLNSIELINSVFIKEYRPDEEPRMRWIRRGFWLLGLAADITKLTVYTILKLAWASITFIVGGVIGVVYNLFCLGDAVDNYMSLRSEFYSEEKQTAFKTQKIEYHESVSLSFQKTEQQSYSKFLKPRKNKFKFSNLKYVPDFDAKIHKKATQAQLFKAKKEETKLAAKEALVSTIASGIILAGCVLWVGAPHLAIGLFLAGTVLQVVSSLVFGFFKRRQQQRIQDIERSMKTTDTLGCDSVENPSYKNILQQTQDKAKSLSANQQRQEDTVTSEKLPTESQICSVDTGVSQRFNIFDTTKKPTKSQSMPERLNLMSTGSCC